MKRKICFAILGVLLTSTIFGIINAEKVESIDPYFSIVFKTNGSRERSQSDMGNLLKQQLARIGIHLVIIIQDWPTFTGELIAFRDFDICYVNLLDLYSNQYFSNIYNENWLLNMLGYQSSMDWDEEKGMGLNEWYMNEGLLMMPPDSEDRVQHYWDWEQYMMDEICPMLPTFVPKSYAAHWANLNDFSYSKGILQSWGEMSWEGLHKGQLTTDEFVICRNTWTNIQPLFTHSNEDAFVESLAYDPLIWLEEDGKYWPHLAKRFDFIDDSILEIELRENIMWSTDPDNHILEEYLDIYDVYFTLYCYQTFSDELDYWDWIDDLEIINDMTLRIHIDGDKETPQKDPYVKSLEKLTVNILPEHYLNQTQLPDDVTPDITHPSWTILEKDCLGTGLFELSSYNENLESIFTMSTNSWWLDESITNDPLLDWNKRFGSFTESPNQLHIRFKKGFEPWFEFEAGRLDYLPIENYYQEKIDVYRFNPDFSLRTDFKKAFEFFGYNMREVRPEMGNRYRSYIDPTISRGLAIRKAISYAIDRAEINRVIYSGGSYITDYPISIKQSIWLYPNIIRYNLDLNKANEYMIKAGYDLAGFQNNHEGFGYGLVILLIIIVAFFILWGSIRLILNLTKERRIMKNNKL